MWRLARQLEPLSLTLSVISESYLLRGYDIENDHKARLIIFDGDVLHFYTLHRGLNFVWIVFVEVQFNMIQNEKGTQAQDVNVVVAPEQASYFGEIKSFNPTKGR